MQRSYESVVIFTPVLTDEEVQQKIGDYREFMRSNDCEIVHEDFWGLRQLAYPIRKKTTGIYLVTEFKSASEFIAKLELRFKRDDGILRFLTVALDKHAVEYNEKKRNGLIGRKKQTPTEETAEDAPAAEVVNTENKEG